jgi:hypothetical protein
MKILSASLFLVIFTALCFNGYAAFPIKKQNAVASAAAEQKNGLSINTLTPPPYHYGNENANGSAGLVSLCMGVAGMACYIAGVATLDAAAGSGSTGLFLAGLVLGIMAMVFGIIGHKRPNRGMAIAGTILGIIEVAIALVVLIIAILVVAALGDL